MQKSTRDPQKTDSKQNKERGKSEAQTDVGQTEVGQTEVGQTDVGQTQVGQTQVGQTQVGQTEVGQTGVGHIAECSNQRDAKEEYSFDSSKVPNGFKFKAKNKNDGSPVNYLSAIQQLQNNDSGFLGSFLNVLRTSVEYKAYFFETPPMTWDKAKESHFEFVLINAEALADVKADSRSFADHFRCATNSVTAFPNLGKDGIMVTPCPPARKEKANLQNFTHLANFVRGGDDDQVNEFWQLVGKEVENWLQNKRDQRVWLSTSGLGVYWLHIRLDSYPKYYTHHPYRNPHSNV